MKQLFAMACAAFTMCLVLEPAEVQASAMSPVQIFNRIDWNDDGFISINEVPPKLRYQFKKADLNKNGVVDLAEFTQMLNKSRSQSHGTRKKTGSTSTGGSSSGNGNSSGTNQDDGSKSQDDSGSHQSGSGNDDNSSGRDDSGTGRDNDDHGSGRDGDDGHEGREGHEDHEGRDGDD